MNNLKKAILFLFFSLLFVTLSAQLPAGINIDQLTDTQLMQYIQQAGLNGLSESELLIKAKEKGLTDDQIQKLKTRMQLLGTPGTQQNQDSKQNPDSKRQPIKYLLPKTSADSINGLLIFGSDIFTKENLTFEPNLNIPTPKNYIIGNGDELKIDIFGFSEKSHSLKITPDGFIRYPNIGPIKLAGLNFDEAKLKLTTILSKIYPGLKSGNTYLQLTIGQIRSIRVNLIGEISRPGTYEVSSLSTIANALYAAGGPTKIGSYRNIELIRSGKSIAKFDLYDYLFRGDLNENRILQDDDVIKVAPYKKRVEVRGALKRNAVYEIIESDKLADVVSYASGLADSANKEFIRVSRFGNQEKEIFTVKTSDATSFSLQSGDKIYVDSIANIFKNRISIFGAVYYQGYYSIDKINTLKDLLLIAKPREVAYKERGMIRRFQLDYTPETISFNVQDVLDGKFNLNLNREDSVHIYDKSELKENYFVQILGEVNKPMKIPFSKGLKVQDAIIFAGGYKDGASKNFVEVSRRIRDTLSNKESSKYAILFTVDLKNPNNSDALNNELQPFDIISIRKSPGYVEQVNVSIEGEVLYPGSYSIQSNQERISDLFKRAGGIKMGAYPEGAFLLRKTFENLSNSDSVILKNKIATLKISTNDSTKANAADSTFKSDLKVLGIKLDEILLKPGSLYDVILQDGDIIKVPKRIETVQTFNGVYFPKKIVYRDDLTIKDVIRESGGVLPGGLQKQAYIVYPNGQVSTTKSFLFFKTYPKVKPGSEIYVPIRKENKGLSTVEILGITTGLATIATMVITIANLTK